ncbi:siderochrome-iron transporter [Pseudovirgaria hyperparasitica]|uniref:Siderochrome-iron transporter n=1 Tax=Pseudovirgaria hyperparasitica TaxID=470096 RepID=A0A6A6WHX7_9PEZI|nr:siderochrome-iron transporter [Pseudovirgaria hyperparasitica]KAF2761839.1 siderochrome-iron transporter [Pseudovirgaria hyperparasitica]
MYLESNDSAITNSNNPKTMAKASIGVKDMDKLRRPSSATGNVPAGVAQAKAAKLLLEKKGKYVIWLGIALIMIMYELDNTTVYVYQNYAPSEFNALSQKATLSTAGVIVAAVAKPPVAKISDVIGRAQTYCITISCYILGYILCSASRNFGTYAGGIIFYAIGQTGTNVLNDIVLSDLSSTRWRSFALSISFFPFLVIPFVAGLICDSVVHAIGWRWGIGMYGFLMPAAASLLVISLFVYQTRARKSEVVLTQKIGFMKFFSLIDAGGLLLLCVGFALLFLPISLTSTSPDNWGTPWIPALMAVGAILLVGLMLYEHYVATHPVLPPRYLRNATIVIAAATIFLDTLAFQCTHVYLYSWATISRGYKITTSTYFLYLNGTVQVFIALIAGLVIARTRRFKWLLFSSTVIRLIGYGLMVRLRGSSNSDAEVWLVQCVQGIGSGVIQIVCITAAQIMVPHAELAQITAVILLCSFLGGGVGSAIAGGIYTSTFESRLRTHLGTGASEETVRAVFESITTALLPAWGTVERAAVNAAYSDVIRSITLAALGCSAPTVLLTLLMKDHKLKDEQTLAPDEVAAKTPESKPDEERNDV